MSNGNNSFDGDKVRSFLDRLVTLEDEKQKNFASIRGQFGADKNQVLEEAKGEGIPKGTLKNKLREILLERKAQKIRDDMESEEQALFDELSAALGDYFETPLGQAAAS